MSPWNTAQVRPLAVVSGAAKGMGKACVETFLEHGWRVAAINNDEALTSTFTPGGDLTPLVADIADEASLATAWERAGSPVTALVNAAGLFTPTSLSEFTVEQYRHIFDVNVLGTLLLSRLASRDMPDGGAIINLSSINGFVGRADQTIYAAIKAAVLSLTCSIAADLAPRGIRVNGIAPGLVDTEGFRAIPGCLEQATKQVPLDRVQTPEEVAEIALWLTQGKGARFVTGETIVCSFGLHKVTLEHAGAHAAELAELGMAIEQRRDIGTL